MLINLISDRPANIAKALRFGRKFLAAGWQVTLLVNIDAVALVNPAAPLGPCPVSGQPLSGMLEVFMAEGGETLVGRECLKLAGLDETALPDGAGIAEFSRTAELMALPHLKTMTW